MNVLAGGPYPAKINGNAAPTNNSNHGVMEEWVLLSSCRAGLAASQKSLEAAVARDVGHPLWVVEKTWQLCNGKYPVRKRQPWKTQHLHYIAMIVANRGTVIDDIPRVAYTPKLTVSTRTYYDVIIPMLEIIVSTLDEIKWENRLRHFAVISLLLIFLIACRLDPFNHTPEFPYYFTHIVDGFPIEIWAPSDYGYLPCFNFFLYHIHILLSFFQHSTPLLEWQIRLSRG
jgi:hypothetical protein